MAILSRVLRPVVASWHPRLGEYEAKRPDEVSQVVWERRWKDNGELRMVLAEVRVTLTDYANLLAAVAEVEPIH